VVHASIYYYIVVKFFTVTCSRTMVVMPMGRKGKVDKLYRPTSGDG
jgi:hypothetical protein